MISIVKYLTEQHLATLKIDPTDYSKIQVVNKVFPVVDEAKEEVKPQLRKFGGKFIKKYTQMKQEQ